MNRLAEQRPRRGWGLALALLVGFVAVGDIGPAVAQDSDWSVEGGEERRQEIIRRYKRLLEKNPTEGVIFKKLVEYVGDGEGLDRLIDEYRKKVSQQPKNASRRLILGHLLKNKNEFEKALKHYDKAVEVAPEDPIVWMSRGSVHVKLRNREKAASDFEKALEHVDNRSRKQKLLRKLADLAFEQHEWDRAEKYYDQLIALDPRNEYLRMEYAQVLVKHRRYKKALEQYRKLLDLAGGNPKSRATTLRDMGDLYEKMGKDKDAVETYRKAMGLMRSSNWLHGELRSRIIDVYRQNDRLAELLGEYESRWGSPGYDRTMLLGKLSDEVGKEDKALKYFRRATRLRSRATQPRVRVIEILRRRGKDREVIEAYKKLSRVAPRESRYQFELVRLYFQLGERDKAVDLLETIGRRFRGDPNVYVTLADTYMRYDMEDEALETYRTLVEMEPDNESYILSLGESYYRAGKMEKAVSTWQRLLDSSLAKPDAHARLGQVYSEHGMIERGVRNYRKAVELRPEDMSIRRGLASTYERARRWDKAIEVWRFIMDETDKPHTKAEARGRIISIYKRQHRLRSKLAEFAEKFGEEPPDMEAGYFLAEGHLKLNNYEKAEETYRRLIDADDQVDKSDIEAYQALERIYRQTGELEEAVKILQKLAKLRPRRQREYYHQIAELSLKLYEDEQAVRYAALAVEKNPEDAEAHARLGEVYRKMQRLQAAAEEYRRAVQLDPKAHRHAMELARIHLELGERKRAEELYREVARKADDDSLVLKAARQAIELAEEAGHLRELEGEFAQLAFRGSDNSVYRKVMLELYERMVTPLMLAMRYGVGAERQEIQKELEEIGSRASPILMSALNGDDIGQRALAVRLLGGMRDTTAALPLARLAVDQEESLRTLAAVSVAEIGDARAAGPLVQALDADDPKLREIATWALGYVGGSKAREALTRQLSKGQNWTEKALAAIGLGRIGGEASVSALNDAVLSTPPGESNNGVLVAVMSALGEIAEPKTVETLEGVYRRSPEDVRVVSAAALAKVGGEKAVRSLLEALWDDRPALRSSALKGLVRVSTGLESKGDDVSEIGERFEALMADAAHIDERRQKIQVPGLIDQRKSEASLVGETKTEAFFVEYADLVAEVAGERLKKGATTARFVLGDLWQSGELRLGILEPSSAKARTTFEKAIRRLAPEFSRLARSDESAVAAPALGMLGIVGSADDASFIVERLGSKSHAIRSAAAAALGRLAGPSEAVDALAKAMRDGSFSVRRSACIALADLAESGSVSAGEKKRVFELLTSALEDDYGSIRIAAVRALGEIGGERSAKLLADRIEDFQIRVKIEALSALSKMETKTAKRVVEEYRDHPDFRIRRVVD